MYHQFKIHKFYVLPAQCIYVFCVDLITNSDCLKLFTNLTFSENNGADTPQVLRAAVIS